MQASDRTSRLSKASDSPHRIDGFFSFDKYAKVDLETSKHRVNELRK